MAKLVQTPAISGKLVMVQALVRIGVRGVAVPVGDYAQVPENEALWLDAVDRARIVPAEDVPAILQAAAADAAAAAAGANVKSKGKKAQE